MMGCIRWAMIIAALHLLVCTTALGEESLIQLVSVPQTPMGQYDCVEVTFNVLCEYNNPCDAGEIAVNAVIDTPSGKRIVYPTFYTRTLRDTSADFTPDRDGVTSYGHVTPDFSTYLKSDADVWALRFSWDEIGEYAYRFEIIQGEKVTTCPGGTFEIVASDQKGPILQSKTNPNYLAYRDSGAQYIPVGMNAAQFYSTGGYTKILEAIARNGGNFARIWSGTDYGYSSLCLENWMQGIGFYNPDMGAALDRVLTVARQNGVNVALAMESFSSLNTNPSVYGQFDTYSIYNTLNDGPISEPSLFWTDPACIRAYQNRVRYIIARYGWDTDIFIWELFNEIDGADHFRDSEETQRQAARWCEDMRAYIRALDPYQRMVGASFSVGGDLDKVSLAAGSALDFLQTHHYGARNVASQMRLMVQKGRQYKQLVFIGEFGPAAGTADKTFEYMHIGLWAGIHAGALGTPMYWWCEEAVDAGYETHLKAISQYVNAFDFVKEQLSPAAVECAGGICALGQTAGGQDRAILYLWNEDYFWASPEPEAKTNCGVALSGLKPGAYTVQLWDTRSGEVIDTLHAQADASGVLRFTLDTIKRDVAAMVQAASAAHSESIDSNNTRRNKP